MLKNDSNDESICSKVPDLSDENGRRWGRGGGEDCNENYASISLISTSH